MTQGLAHKLPDDGEVHRNVPEAADPALPAEAPLPADADTATIDARDKIALGLVLIAGGCFYCALVVWLL